MDQQTARRRLTGTLEELDRSSETLTTEDSRDAGELTVVDQHPADAATNLSDNDREDALREVVQSQREQIQDALARLDGGSYGTCVDCGATLPDDRLEARPEAARCVACQGKLEDTR